MEATEARTEATADRPPSVFIVSNKNIAEIDHVAFLLGALKLTLNNIYYFVNLYIL
jgi:hypothetical protein